MCLGWLENNFNFLLLLLSHSAFGWNDFKWAVVSYSLVLDDLRGWVADGEGPAVFGMHAAVSEVNAIDWNCC